MYKYEFGAIFACESKSDEDIQVLIGKVREIINDCHGRIVKEDVWGKKELTYPIKKQNFGFYMFTTMMMEPAETKKLQEKLKLTDGILRYLLLNLDKEPGYRQHQSHLESREANAPKTEDVDTEEEGIVEEVVKEEVKTESKPEVKAVKKEVKEEKETVEEEVKKEPKVKTEAKAEKPKAKTATKKAKPAAKEEVEVKKEEAKEEPVKEEVAEEPKKKESKPAKDLDQLLDEIL